MSLQSNMMDFIKQMESLGGAIEAEEGSPDMAFIVREFNDMQGEFVSWLKCDIEEAIADSEDLDYAIKEIQELRDELAVSEGKLLGYSHQVHGLHHTVDKKNNEIKNLEQTLSDYDYVNSFRSTRS